MANLAEDPLADDRLVKAGEQLARFAGGSGRTLDVRRSAVLLASTASVIRARNDTGKLQASYGEMHANVVQDIQKFGAKTHRMVEANRRAGRRDLAEPAGLYAGLLAQSVVLGILTRFRGVFAMPALPHHDRSRDPAESHDIVLLAKDAASEWGEEGEQRPPFVLQKAQIKNHCLALCPPEERAKGSESSLHSCQRRYYDDIVLCSAHCDTGRSPASLRTVVAWLVKEQRGDIQPKERLKLEEVSRMLARYLLAPESRRMGNMPTAFRGRDVEQPTHITPRRIQWPPLAAEA